MQICGLTKTTLIDYPEHLAALIFLGGCNFRCPFCHNSPLVRIDSSTESHTEEEILAYLLKRKNILEGLCISGGEPTLHGEELLSFMERVKELGYLIKLDTNGTNPVFLEKAFNRGLLDYVAMDIKNDPQNYSAICGIKTIDMDSIRASVDWLKTSRIPYEFRTTVVAEFHNADNFRQIGRWLQGESNYYLQQFKDTPSVLSEGLHNYDKEKMESFRQLLLPFVPHTFLRGLD